MGTGPISRQLSQEEVFQAHREAPLQAILTKAPAAFFARMAVGLCTDQDANMWEESRHAHVVILDAEDGTLVGMAMVYVERIPAISRKGTTLVMRAINLPARLREAFDPGSVADAFLALGRQLAHTGRHTALALPPQTGQHLLSNDEAVAKAITQRLRNTPFELVTLGEPFYAYARRDDRAVVEMLYAQRLDEPMARQQHSYP